MRRAVNADLVDIEDSVEGCRGVADGEEGNEDEQAVIDMQGEGELEVQHCCHVSLPNGWSQEASHDVQQH